MPEDDYDPYANRPPPEKGVSKPTAFFYVIQTILGTGILAMPYCMARLGWFIGLIVLFGSYVLLISATHLLFYCKKRVCIRHKMPQLTYRESLVMCLEDGPKFLSCLSHTIKYESVIYPVALQFGVLGIFHIYIGYAFFLVKPLDCPLYLYFLSIVPVLMAMNLIKHMKNTIQALMVIILTTISAYTIFAYFIMDPPSYHEVHTIGGDIKKMPITLGVFVYSIHTPLIMNLEETMYTPKALLGWCGIINVANAIVMVLYGGFGFLGYYVFGDDVDPIFIKNLPRPDELADSAMIIHATAIIFSYHLQSKYITKLIWKNYFVSKFPEGVSECRINCFETLFRICIPFVGLILVMMAPFVESLMAFLGIIIIVIGVIYPGLMALSTALTEKEGYWTLLPLGLLMIIVGGVSLLCIAFGIGYELFRYIADGKYVETLF